MFVDCPNEDCDEEAYVWGIGDAHAGIVDCDACGYFDVCPHEDSHIEVDESIPRDQLDEVYNYPLLICDLCGLPTEEEIVYEREMAYDCE